VAEGVSDFLDITDLEERSIVQRRAYEVVSAWLDTLRIEPREAR
jgi:hypothetical protein